MIRRIDHVSIAVRDLERARTFFLDGLGGRELYCAPVPEQKYRWTTVELGTSCLIELIDPLEKDGFLDRFLEKRGEGPHHITVQVNDLQETYRILQEKGIPTFGYAEPFPGWKELYVHPKNAFGTLIQFAEFDPLDWIQPGYIPAAYKEFIPSEGGVGEEKIEVHKMETERGPEIEIRQGEEVIRIPQARLEALIQILKQQRAPCASLPE
ncbi:MAG: VOC family protein [Deltaproteobacteria bacterium]|jgi:methylmalonyl-CoA/ethylmalonyl-CoA epimerase|nr:VOC family protein [Deltaproteobacteria bacterium]